MNRLLVTLGIAVGCSVLNLLHILFTADDVSIQLGYETSLWIVPVVLLAILLFLAGRILKIPFMKHPLLLAFSFIIVCVPSFTLIIATALTGEL